MFNFQNYDVEEGDFTLVECSTKAAMWLGHQHSYTSIT